MNDFWVALEQHEFASSGECHHFPTTPATVLNYCFIGLEKNDNNVSKHAKTLVPSIVDCTYTCIEF